MTNVHAHDPVETRKHYFKIFKYLVVLTVLEVIFVKLPLPKLVITLLVVTASCTKAGLVGYYYMHLKAETTWLKVAACLPILMFGYLAVLGPDSHQRTFKEYDNQPARIFPASHEEIERATENAGTESAPVKVREINVGPGQEGVEAPEAKVNGEASAPQTASTSGAATKPEATKPESAKAAAPVSPAAPAAPAAGGASADEFR